jgi:hypothetical protein
MLTYQDLELYLARDFTVTEQQAADQALTLAQGVVEAYCARSFTREEGIVGTFDATGRLVSLPAPPVEVHDVTTDGTSVDGYKVFADSGLLELPSSHANRRVEVTYDAGIDGLPDVARAVILSIASRMFINSDSITQKSIGDVSISYSGASAGPGLTDAEQMALSTLRLGSVR